MKVGEKALGKDEQETASELLALQLEPWLVQKLVLGWFQ